MLPDINIQEESVPHGNIRMLGSRKNIHESAQTHVGYSYNYIQNSLADQQVKCIRATEILQLKAISNRTHKRTLIQYYIFTFHLHLMCKTPTYRGKNLCKELTFV